ncbi:MAG: metallophosphoesterase [Desulfobacteraceae bacterium]|nr:metallophosphoesterase [Desulfobacteraceae bacterium]
MTLNSIKTSIFKEEVISVFGTVLTVFVTILTIYVFLRFDFIVKLKFPEFRKIIIISGFFTWGLFLISRIFRKNYNHEFYSDLLQIYGMHLMGSLICLSVAFFISDFLSGFGFFFKKHKQKIRVIALFAGTVMILTAHVQGLRFPVIEKSEIKINNLPKDLENFKIAVLSDLHAGEMMITASWIEKLALKLESIEPDLVLIAGDIFERKADPEKFIPAMKKIKAPFGVYAVRGNHDSLRFNRNDVAGKILSEAGIVLLSNEWVKLENKIVLAGIDDLTVSSRNKGEMEENFNKTVLGLPKGISIFLSHTPWMVEEASEKDFDLMFSGHTHNGQIWPFNLLVKTKYKYLSGLYQINNMNLYVSRGAGTWGPRMRLWKPGEISLIVLKNTIKQPSGV